MTSTNTILTSITDYKSVLILMENDGPYVEVRRTVCMKEAGREGRGEKEREREGGRDGGGEIRKLCTMEILYNPARLVNKEI